MATTTSVRTNVSSGGACKIDLWLFKGRARGQRCACCSGTCAPVGHEKSDAYTQARAALAIIEKALGEAGAKTTDVVRTVVYLRDINDAEDVARAHLETFDKVRPASTLVQVTSMLRPWQKVESRPTPRSERA